MSLMRITFPTCLNVFALFFGITFAVLAPLLASADSIAEQQATLQRQLDAINKEIAQNHAQLAGKQKERVSLERDVAILDYQIAQAQLEIKQRDLTIQKIKNNIKQKEGGIESLDSSVAAGQESIAQILRETRRIDDTPLAARVLGEAVRDYFRELDDFASIHRALGVAFTEMAVARDDLSARKAALQEEQTQESQLLQLQVAQRNSLRAKEEEKKNLVASVKGQEAAYQNIIAGKQRTAAQIQAALFALRDTEKQVSFGDIYQYAKEASLKTGVRPALPNPYDPRTAVFASAILMADNGADLGTPAAERLAALRYFAGWKNASNPSYAFYGNDVMSLAAKFQNDINVVSG